MNNVNALTSSLAFVWLVPCRGAGPAVHLVERDSEIGLWGPSLCGQSGPLDRYGRSKFRRVHGRGASRVCNACHAFACKQPTRIDW